MVKLLGYAEKDSPVTIMRLLRQFKVQLEVYYRQVAAMLHWYELSLDNEPNDHAHGSRPYDLQKRIVATPNRTNDFAFALFDHRQLRKIQVSNEFRIKTRKRSQVEVSMMSTLKPN